MMHMTGTLIAVMALLIVLVVGGLIIMQVAGGRAVDNDRG